MKEQSLSSIRICALLRFRDVTAVCCVGRLSLGALMLILLVEREKGSTPNRDCLKALHDFQAASFKFPFSTGGKEMCGILMFRSSASLNAEIPQGI